MYGTHFYYADFFRIFGEALLIHAAPLHDAHEESPDVPISPDRRTPHNRPTARPPDRRQGRHEQYRRGGISDTATVGDARAAAGIKRREPRQAAPRNKKRDTMIQRFVTMYREAFGEAAPLPIAFGYGDTPAAAVGTVPRCMIGAIRRVCGGEPLALCAGNVLCGGGSLYTAFAPMQDRIPRFVSEAEHYKRTPEQVREYIGRLDIRLTEKPYLNFVRMDRLDALDDVEGILFFATPDILAGLCSWAFYDNDADEAVSTRFASGCCSIVTFAVGENRRGGRSCFIGLLDPSARPLVPANELTFVIPACRFREMALTMEHSALFQKAYSAVRRRINGEIK